MSHTFFTDRDLGKQFPAILREAGLLVERHADHFADDCPDEDWLAVVGRRRWVAITHDQRIRYKPNELSAVVRHAVSLLVVIGKAPFAELARNFVATQQPIEAFLASQDPPFIAKVYRAATPNPGESGTNNTGRVERWYPPR